MAPEAMVSEFAGIESQELAEVTVRLTVMGDPVTF